MFVRCKLMSILSLTLNMGNFGPSSADGHICTGTAWARTNRSFRNLEFDFSLAVCSPRSM
jgi:hypothetical protein